MKNTKLDFETWVCMFMKDADMKEDDIIFEGSIDNKKYKVTAGQFFHKCLVVKGWQETVRISLMYVNYFGIDATPCIRQIATDAIKCGYIF